MLIDMCRTLRQVFPSHSSQRANSGPVAGSSSGTAAPVQEALARKIAPVAVSGASSLGKLRRSDTIELALMLPRRNEAGFQAQLAAIKRGERPFMTLEELELRYGAEQEHLDAVQKWAKANRLQVNSLDAGRRMVVLSARVSKLNSAFRTELERFDSPKGRYRTGREPIELPRELQGKVMAVIGLVGHEPGQIQSHLVRATDRSRAVSYTPPQVAEAYQFPAGTDGTGHTIGFIELGGGWRQRDLDAYFGRLGMKTPAVSAVGVDGAKNAPTGDPNGPDGEVVSDLEVAGGMAPGAKLVTYHGQNSNSSYLNAFVTAIHDGQNKPDAISTSWGSPESSWTQEDVKAFHSAFQDASALGVSLFAASGDNGASDDAQTNDGWNADYPASDSEEHATGGTSLRLANGSVASEVAWGGGGTQDGASGGGESTFFPVPPYQAGIKAEPTNGPARPLAHRGVPDWAFVADPATGYEVLVDGQSAVIGGTSLSAPAGAALSVRMAQQLGVSRLGDMHATFYGNPGAFTDITSGDNGEGGAGWRATPGWDAVTGMGRPRPEELARALRPPANPSSASTG